MTWFLWVLDGSPDLQTKDSVGLLLSGEAEQLALSG